MTFCNKYFSLVILLISFPYCSQAQYPVKKFYLEKENKPVRINLVFKKNDGYLLLGTSDGLYKFDGLEFTRITFQNPDYNDTVTAIAESRDNILWIGFQSGRIANLQNNKLIYWNPEEGTPKKKITSLCIDKQNNLWFGTAGEGVYYYQNKRLHLLDTDEGLPDNNVNAVSATSDGIIAGTDQGLAVVHIIGGNPTMEIITPKNGLPDYLVTAISPSDNNEVWIGFEDKGFCNYNTVTKKLTIPNLKETWRNGAVNSILSFKNQVWLGSSTGLIQYNIAGNTLAKATIDATNITCIMNDNTGGLWFTGKDNSLSGFAAGSIIKYPFPPGIVFEHLHTFLKDHQSRYWLTNPANELLVYDSTLTQLLHKVVLPGINERTDVTSSFQDNNGLIWIGSVGGGIYSIDPNSLQIHSYLSDNSIPNKTILSISGNNKALFVSSLEGNFIIQPGTYMPLQFSGQSGMNYVYAIFQDSKDRIWFATDGNGLYKLEDDKYTIYNKPLIADNKIYSVTESPDGHIWFSTARSGVYSYNGKKFKAYGLEDGISDLNISSVKCSKKGKIIISHKHGLDILDPLTNKIVYLNSSGGISDINVEDLDAVETVGENFLFSTSSGIVSYRPTDNDLPQPKTIIESVQLFLNDINTSEHGFGHEDNNFTFSYTGLYYADPDAVYFQYKLEGFDSSWIFTTDRVKSFPRLSPGNYVFRVRSSLNKGFISSDEASYSFTIRQAFYKTWWFLTAVSIVLISLLFT